MAPDRRKRTRRDLGLEPLLATRHARERRLRRRRRSVLSIVVLLVAGIVVFGAAAAVITGQSILDSQCSLKDLRPLSLGSNSFLYTNSHTHKLLGVVPSATNRQPLPLARMSHWLPKATVAIEDARFYEHGALDYRGIVRAFYEDLASGRIAQGASTLTQQLVRNLYIGNQEKTFSRKIKEACLADKEFARMQATYGKDARARILAAYLNEVYYGHSAYGVQAAARTYFSRNASDLSLGQAALIAGLPQAPSQYDPLGANPKDALHRRNQVLQAMLKNHSISRGDFQIAIHKPLGLKKGHLYTQIHQPNFFGWAKDELVSRFGKTQVDRGGLNVTTTLDPRLQALALSAAKNVLRTSTDPATAIVAIDPRNGAVKAMVDYFPDGRHLKFNQFHLATDAHRSTGSAFKPITLATALDEGASLYSSFYGPSELYITDPQCATAGGPNGWWDVHNSGDESVGNANLLGATAGSINTIFAQLIAKAGVSRVVQMAHWLGITTPSGPNAPYFKPVCAITLGSVGFTPLELTDVYATIASGGIHHAPQAFETVTGPHSKVLSQISTVGKDVLAPNIAAELQYALEGVITSGTGTAANIGRPAAGKTGTAENYQDAWFCGFVPQLATCVWIGYPTGEISLTNVEGVGTVFGGTLPAEIWHDFMSPAVAPWPVKPLPGTLGAPLPIFGGSTTDWGIPGAGTYQSVYTPTYPTYPSTTTTATTTP
jgi:penicillin-binding protein 1A